MPLRLYRIIFLAAALPLLHACDLEQPQATTAMEEVPRPAKIVEPKRLDGGVPRTYPGTLEAAQQAELAFRVSGQLIELPALAGLRVNTGDLLARLDPTDFENTLAERQARFDLADTQLKQARELLKKKLSSQLQFDQANAELKSARAALDQARDNLRYTSLKAPFGGVVARVDIENHQPVQAQTPVLQLRTDDHLAIRFSVPESILSQLRRVDDPKVVDSFCGEVRFVIHPGKSFRACHKEHDSVPDQFTRNYSALFSLGRIDDFVALPGMTATIKLDFSPFLADQAAASLYVPVEAVFSEHDKRWLWRVDEESRARLTEVSVGDIEGGQIAIASGIDPDSRVIAAGVSFVREGMLVKPIVKQRGL